MRVGGETAGLKARDRRALERLHGRRLPRAVVVPQDFARRLSALSRRIRRQVGVLVDRSGAVRWVGVGDARQIELPDLKRQRAAGVRLRGLRFLHTHLAGEPLTRDDLADLVLLRLDLIAAITVDEGGLPLLVHAAHIRPPTRPGAPRPPDETPWELIPPAPPSRIAVDCQELVAGLEQELARLEPRRPRRGYSGRAILVGVAARGEPLDERVEELGELARDAGLVVVDAVQQRRPRLDPRTLVGKGKLRALVIRALDRGADVILFSRDLSPAQARNIARATDLKVLDRTQLILDVFARRARSRDGRIQVELAQLRYRLPRLVGRDPSLSRLGGGIGGRGPGETMLEVDRRRVRARIARLRRDLAAVAVKRRIQRRLRDSRGVPVVSLVGYTNAGKSTLLNRLTHSRVAAGNRMFETLDPANRRLRVPVEREVLLSDTVGFIQDLPSDLIDAFRATLEEISAASLLLHVVDAADPRREARADAVEGLLATLGFSGIPRVTLLNKTDRLPGPVQAALPDRFAGAEAIPVSARTGEGVDEVLAAVARLIPMPVAAPYRARKASVRLPAPRPRHSV